MAWQQNDLLTNGLSDLQKDEPHQVGVRVRACGENPAGADAQKAYRAGKKMTMPAEPLSAQRAPRNVVPRMNAFRRNGKAQPSRHARWYNQHHDEKMQNRKDKRKIKGGLSVRLVQKITELNHLIESTKKNVKTRLNVKVKTD